MQEEQQPPCPRCTTNNGSHTCGIQRKRTSRQRLVPETNRASRRKMGSADNNASPSNSQTAVGHWEALETAMAGESVTDMSAKII